MKTTEAPVIVSQSFTCSADVLWRAITDHHHMIQWFFQNIPHFHPQQGFTTRFIVENEGRVFPHIWTIVEVDQGKKIVYNWKYEGYDGDANVHFEISEEPGGCTLTVTNEVIADFQENVPEFSRDACQGGWTYFINQRLAAYISSL